MPLMDPRAYLRPLEYEWAWAAYLAQNQAHWMPTEVPMSTDVVDYWDKLTAEERNLLIQVLRLFTTMDMSVQGNYQARLMPMFPVPEVAMMLASFANAESIHVHAYSYLIDTLGLPEAEYKAFLVKLIAARKARGMTQRDVAEALGIPQPRVSRIETGERMVNAVELRHFATLYRKPLSYFV